MKNNMKQGNIFIAVGILFLIIISFAFFVVYYQLNILCNSVRKDLYYACNAAILSFDQNELKYNNYKVDKNKTQEIIDQILNKNYIEDNNSIIEIKTTDLKLEYDKDSVRIITKIKVKFKIVINFSKKNEHEFYMKENIKIALMDYRAKEIYE